MDIMDRNKAYNEYVLAREPATKFFPSLIWAFLVGGLICVLGEGMGDLVKLIAPALAKEDVSAYVSAILIFLASFLTGIGVYDKIGAFAGAGSIVPITGFSNSVTSPAIEFKKEGLIFGTCAKMFTIAGPVLVYGISTAILVGIGYFLFNSSTTLV